MGVNVLDNVFDYQVQDQLYNVCRNSAYTIGWQDSEDIELLNRPFFHCKGDVKSILVKEIDLHIRNTSFGNKLTNYKMFSSTINCSRPGETYYEHLHPGGNKVVLYYPNFNWKREWGGETMFYDNKNQDLKFACEYRPNRLIIFDGEIPHSVRAPTYIADQYRFTMSFFYSPK